MCARIDRHDTKIDERDAHEAALLLVTLSRTLDYSGPMLKLQFQNKRRDTPDRDGIQSL
jgi:hypothetical protein